MWFMLAVGAAVAWEPGTASREPGPLTWCVTPAPDAAVDPDAQVAITARVFAAWAAVAPCVGLSFAPVGRCEEGAADVSVWLDAPEGVSGLPRVEGTQILVERESQHAWRDDEGPEVHGTVRLSTVLAYGVGRVLGLVDTCTGPACDDRGAVMAAQRYAYVSEVRTPTVDDGRSLVATYGQEIAFTCPNTVMGATPLTVTCEPEAPGPFQWRWGDGGAAERTHVYTTPGRYEAVIRGADVETCLWGGTALAVRACAPNATPFVATDDGEGRLRLSIGVPLVSECVTEVQWTVSDADGEVIASPSSASAIVAVPQAGAWTVRLDIDGGGGAASTTRVVGAGRGCGVTTSRSGALTLVAWALSRRRRRR